MLRIVVSQGGEELGAGDYSLGLVRIGSDDDNDLQVEHEDLSAHHVEVFLFGKRAYARSPDGQPLRVDGEPVEGRVELNDGQSIQIGDFAFQVRVAPIEASDREDTKTYKSGRVKLRGTELLALPSHEEHEQLLLAARRVLVGQGASETQLERLRLGGADLAEEILENHARQGLDDLAGELGANRSPAVAATVARQRERSTTDTWHLLKTLVWIVLALSACGVVVVRVSQLLVTFTR